MRAKYVTAFFICVFQNFIFSQTENIVTDRPDQTESPAIVAPKHIQVENGFSIENVNDDSKNTIFHTSLWRYGVNDNFELRMITDLRQSEGIGYKVNGFTPIKLGFKSKLSEEAGIWPQLSFIGHIAIPTLASDAFKSDFYAPSFRFAMQNTLSKKVGLGYNIGAEWDGVSAEPSFLYTISSSISITEKLGCFFEWYGFLPQTGSADNRADTGLTYFITPNFMIDVSGGIGLSSGSPDSFISGGFSFRLPR